MYITSEYQWVRTPSPSQVFDIYPSPTSKETGDAVPGETEPEDGRGIHGRMTSGSYVTFEWLQFTRLFLPQ